MKSVFLIGHIFSPSIHFDQSNCQNFHNVRWRQIFKWVKMLLESNMQQFAKMNYKNNFITPTFYWRNQSVCYSCCKYCDRWSFDLSYLVRFYPLSFLYLNRLSLFFFLLYVIGIFIFVLVFRNSCAVFLLLYKLFITLFLLTLICVEFGFQFDWFFFSLWIVAKMVNAVLLLNVYGFPIRVTNKQTIKYNK